MDRAAFLIALAVVLSAVPVGLGDAGAMRAADGSGIRF
jgi:hypothetical protein